MVETARELSRHTTSEGTVVYTRGADGGLHVWLTRQGPAVVEPIADGGPEAQGDLVREACA